MAWVRTASQHEKLRPSSLHGHGHAKLVGKPHHAQAECRATKGLPSENPFPDPCPVRRFKLVESSRDPLPGRLTVFVSMSTPPAGRLHHDACPYVVSRYPIHLSRNAALESRTTLALAAKIIRLAHVRISFPAKSSVRGCASMNREGSWGSGRSVSPSCMAMSGD
jgi:hypothetical protein